MWPKFLAGTRRRIVMPSQHKIYQEGSQFNFGCRLESPLIEDSRKSMPVTILIIGLKLKTKLGLKCIIFTLIYISVSFSLNC